MLVTDTTSRHCSRCHRPLTDPASRECGVGPVCRGKDNTLYSKTIETNLPAASAIVLGTNTEDFPKEAQDRWDFCKKQFIKKMQAAQHRDGLIYTGVDFREVVRGLDFILSFELTTTIQNRMIKLVQYLGYPGLAGVLSQEASLSKAKVWFENGRVHLLGKWCSPGYRALCSIPHARIPRRGSKDRTCSVPATRVDEFLEIVQRHWPLYEGDLEEIRAEAKAFASTTNEVNSVASPELAIATISHRSDDLVIRFPWVKNAPMSGLLSKLKEIPKDERTYNPQAKYWTCKKQHEGLVREALLMVFKESEIAAVETKEKTPDGLYAPRRSQSYHGRGYPRRRWRRR